MHCSHLRPLLALCATLGFLAAVGAGPASADVDCADLGSRSTAQSYLDGRSGDLDRLDADADGQACESSDTDHLSRWTLPGLAVLVLGALVLNQLSGRRRVLSSTLRSPTPSRTSARVPAQRLPEQGGWPAPSGHKPGHPDTAPDGSLTGLPPAGDNS